MVCGNIVQEINVIKNKAYLKSSNFLGLPILLFDAKIWESSSFLIIFLLKIQLLSQFNKAVISTLVFLLNFPKLSSFGQAVPP